MDRHGQRDEVRLHQSVPAHMLECEGAKIAVEGKVAERIYVWVKPD